MTPRPPIRTAFARLLPTTAAGDRRRYRPLLAGVALLTRDPGAAAWTVTLASDATLRPRPPRGPDGLARRIDALARRGIASRLCATVAGPRDASSWPLVRDACADLQGPLERLRLDFYGWALMYQPPGLRGRGLVDADDRFADLPAVFELPLELIDRAEFLESKGFRTRPLVIPTLPGDFDAGPDGRLRNRFFPAVDCRVPCGLDRLL